MNNPKHKDLIAYASAFVSFILPKIEVEEIILFGSTARNEAAKNSDIDLFFNTKDKEKNINAIIKKELDKFYKSNIHERWSLKGINNPIKIETGNLEKWKLKRSIISEGIVLYGKYKTLPKNLKVYTQFNLKPIKDITKRNKIIRLLFGRKEKNHQTQGLIKKAEGKKLSPTSFITPTEKSSELIKHLQDNKLDFSFFEFWTDEI